MKKILCAIAFTFLMLGDYLYSQEAKYFLDIRNIKIDTRVADRCCDNISSIKVIYKDKKGSKKIFETDHLGYDIISYFKYKEKPHVFTDILNYPIEYDIEYIEIYRRVVDAQNEIFSTCCNCPHTSEAEGTKKEYNLINCDVKKLNIRVRSGDNQASGSFEFDIKIRPNHTLQPELKSGVANKYLPIDDKIGLLAKKGFDNDMYNYQYTFTPSDEKSWKDVPSHLSKKDKLEVSARDLFGDKSKIHFGKKIYFRVVSCSQRVGSFLRPIRYKYQSKSEVVPLTIIPSAPRVKNIKITSPLCSDGKGSVLLTFDRKLYPNETNVVFYVDNHEQRENYETQLRHGNTLRIDNLSQGNHNFRITSEYQSDPTYSDGQQYKEFIIPTIAPVRFEVEKSKNIFCYEGNDGEIVLRATGGTGTYEYSLNNESWQSFDKLGKGVIRGLQAGAYKVRVRDTQGCISKEAGKPKEVMVNLSAPQKPVQIIFDKHTDQKMPTGYGLSNGYISVMVTGGTPDSNGKYSYQWRKGSPTGSILTNVTQSNVGGFGLKLKDIGAGKYYLTVKDSYFDKTNSNNGCRIDSQEFIVTEPEPLLSEIKIGKLISCHIANKYDYKQDQDDNGIPDEAEDGILVVQASGGVGKYSYQWQKEKNNRFETIKGATDPILKKVTAGKYKVIIKDANANTTSSDYTIKYPQELTLKLSAKSLKCYNGTEGSITSTVRGGVGNYLYQWSTQDTTPNIGNLSSGNYFVLVTDQRNCHVNGSITITEPEPLKITETEVQSPLSPSASDGKISIEVSGGEKPYVIQWSNNKKGKSITGLPKGKYIVTVTDKNQCTISKEYILTDPNRLEVNLGKPQVTLCKGDSVTYDVSINDATATYKWTDQKGLVISTSPKITIATAGIYNVEVRNSFGNYATDKVEIKILNTPLSPDFMLTTHAYTQTSVILVNTSATPAESVEWVIPSDSAIEQVRTSDEYIELLFHSAGTYTIGLKGKQGGCEKIFYKDIVVQENTAGVELSASTLSNIEEFVVVPNPNQGQYKVLVRLSKASPIILKFFNMNAHKPFAPVQRGAATNFEVPFNYTLPSGVYLVVLETSGEVMVKKMIVQ